jgi:penicillin-binding protein 2
MGKLDFVQGLAQSCNVYFYTLGGGFGDIEGLHSDRLGRYARLLGYGESTGIDLPSEAAGRVPTAEWKLANFHEQWRPGDTYNMAIGQGFVLATPLQVANLTSGLAQGGVFRQPHVVRAVLDSEGQVHQAATQPARRVALREDTLAAIREGMIGVLETPQTHAHQVPEFKVAGKTGTAEYPGPKDEKGIGPTHGWFTAYAPWDRPSVSITVFVERGGGPGTALPLAMEVFREYFARYNP